MSKQKSSGAPLKDQDLLNASGKPINRTDVKAMTDQLTLLSSQRLPSFIEIQSDEEDREIRKQMSKLNGGKVKQYKKEKSLGILCQ